MSNYQPGQALTYLSCYVNKQIRKRLDIVKFEIYLISFTFEGLQHKYINTSSAIYQGFL